MFKDIEYQLKVIIKISDETTTLAYIILMNNFNGKKKAMNQVTAHR